MQIEQHSEAIHACRYCFMCRHVATTGVATCHESDIPRGKGLILYKILKGYEEWNTDFIDTIYRSSMSGMDHEFCEGHYGMAPAVLSARQDIVLSGQEPEAVQAIKTAVLENHNPFGISKDKRFEHIDSTGLNGVSPDVLYYVGDDSAFLAPETANAFIAILKKAGVKATVLAGEPSTGKALTMLGYQTEPAAMARELAARIIESGAKTVVTADPNAFDALKNDFPGQGAILDGIGVVDAVSFIEQLIKDKKITLSKKDLKKITVLDSDMLCRRNDVADGIRAVLSGISTAPVLEMHWKKKLAHSVGEVGGYMDILHPELVAKHVERLVLEQVSTVNADTLVTVSPFAKAVISKYGDAPFVVKDLMELVAEAI